MTDDEIDTAITAALSTFAGDQRMRDLFIWGAYTDRVPHPCECCGTPLVLVEHADNHTFPTTWKQWVEIKHDNGPDITDLVFYDHDPPRCRSLRKERS